MMTDNTNIENSNIFQSGTNVGIGTSSPDELLTINGAGKNLKLNSTLASTNEIIFSNSAIRMGIRRIQNANDLEVYSHNGGVGNVATFDYDAGYVGVTVQSTSNTTYVQLYYLYKGVDFNQTITTAASGTAYFPVLPAGITINVGNTDTYIGDTVNATVSLAYYH